MKIRPYLNSAGICLSSLISIFGGHSAQATGASLKDASKKNNRTSQTDKGSDTTASRTPGQSYKPPERGRDRFPWRRNIVTTTFWIGEKPTQNNPVPNHMSSWDREWAENYGGTDTPDTSERNAEYIPESFTPGQNPFYIALPYNDKTITGHKPEASKVIPWFNDEFESPHKSTCKGRWIAIRYEDRIAYAQWEDVGPFRTDNWEYVFGDARPSPNINNGAGLDVSPAVRDYLGMESSDVTDWKFVEFEEVPPGPWARYGDNNTFVQHRRIIDAATITANDVEAEVTQN
ncbi:MAG: hypothetical protein WA771_12700 [Chthoniobacterales bacterium]